MDNATHIVDTVVGNVWHTFMENWPYLTIGILFAAALRTYVGTSRIASALRGKTWLTVIGAVLLATFTPFCSCGTEAVVLSLMAGSVPWAPIVAFMVASPLTSPEQLVMSGGYFGWPFAITYFVGATALGLGAGWLTAMIEKTGWLRNQARMDLGRYQAPAAESSCCSATTEAPAAVSVAAGGTDSRSAQIPIATLTAEAPASAGNSSCCTVSTSDSAAPSDVTPGFVERLKMRELGGTVWAVARRLLLFFFAFSALGYLLIAIIPNNAISGLVGGDSPFAVPAMALLGIPVYITTDGSLPLVASMMHAGMGNGAAMAFLITGAGTSIGAIAGSLIIARWRLVGLVVGILLVGGMILGLGTQFAFD
jgi:uncharacterized membrane protein YraQ (UPF0718 family)